MWTPAVASGESSLPRRCFARAVVDSAHMFPPGGPDRLSARASEGAIQADVLGMEARHAAQDQENALLRQPVDRADGRAGNGRRRALMLIGIAIAVAIVWLVAGNAAGLIAGGVAGAAALALAFGWWRQASKHAGEKPAG